MSTPPYNYRAVTRRKKMLALKNKLGEQKVAECLRCRREFTPSKRGHVYCGSDCRHRGPRKEDESTVVPTEEQLARLFDPARDPESRVDADDWHPTSWDPFWVELDLRHRVVDPS